MYVFHQFFAVFYGVRNRQTIVGFRFTGYIVFSLEVVQANRYIASPGIVQTKVEPGRLTITTKSIVLTIDRAPPGVVPKRFDLANRFAREMGIKSDRRLILLSPNGDSASQ